MKRIKELGKQTFASLSVRNFRLYLTGQAISLVGTWIQRIAQSWLVLQLTNSGTQLGLITAMQFLPILFLAPVGGMVADRVDKRKILFCTQSILAVLALLLGILVLTNSVQLWIIYIFATCLGVIGAFDNPTRNSFVSEMVGTKNVGNAIGLSATQTSIARAVGPAVAGVVISLAGLGLCFVINAFSFMAVIIVLAMMRPAELHRKYKTIMKEKKESKFADGFKYVLSSPVLFDALFMMAIIGTLTYEFNVSLPLLAKNTFNGNVGGYATLVSALGLGSILGGLMGANKHKTNQKYLITVAFLFGVSFLLVAFMPTLFWAAVSLFFVGIFSINFNAWGNSTMQRESDPSMRGQVMALWTMAFIGSTAIGGPIIGFIGEHAGPRWAVSVGGVAAILVSGIAALRLAVFSDKTKVI
jgi:MFS family permease